MEFSYSKFFFENNSKALYLYKIIWKYLKIKKAIKLYALTFLPQPGGPSIINMEPFFLFVVIWSIRLLSCSIFVLWTASSDRVLGRYFSMSGHLVKDDIFFDELLTCCSVFISLLIIGVNLAATDIVDDDSDEAEFVLEVEFTDAFFVALVALGGTFDDDGVDWSSEKAEDTQDFFILNFLI